MAILLSLRVLGAPVPVLTLDGTVNPGSADYLVQGIRQAQQDGAPGVIIIVDTPGGLVSSAREIVQAELSSQIPVVVYVSPSGARAGSAGVFITMAAHVAAMAPGTTIGAAHPVDLFGSFGSSGGSDDESGSSTDAGVMEEKILNDTLAWARAIAEQRGRNADWAEAAVRQSEAITDREALEQGVVDLVATDLDDLLAQAEGLLVNGPEGRMLVSTGNWEPFSAKMTIRQGVVHFLGDPNVIFALLALGLLGLYVEFHNPGLILPGVLGVGMLIAVAIGLSVLPFNAGGMLLVVFGFALFALEIWVTSYGVLTLGGVLSLLLGGVLMFNVEDLDLRIEPSVLFGVVIVAAGFVVLVAYLVIRTHRQRIATGADALPGSTAQVSVGGSGQGWVQLEGETWRARWNGNLEPGTIVRVLKVDRLFLEVEAFSQQPVQLEEQLPSSGETT